MTLDGFEIEKLGFERMIEEVEKTPMDFDPYGNNNVVAMMRKMSYFPWMSLRKTMKGPVVKSPTIVIATPPFELGYKPIDEDLLEMEVKNIARAKAKAKGLPSPSEFLRSYTSTLNGKFIKAGNSQRY